MKLQIKKLRHEVNIPLYATEGSAAIDLTYLGEPVWLRPNESVIFGTGLAMALPEGYAGFIVPRSGWGVKGIVVGNLVGVIDSDYRGEIKVCLWNRSENEFRVSTGDRIAQMVFQAVTQMTMEEVDTLPETKRGVGGFGSTGN